MITKLTNYLKENVEKEYTFLNWILSDYPTQNTWKLRKHINCGSSRITSLKGIENCTALQVLYCNDNSITSLEGIENLINLQYLNCSNTKITSLKGVENLTNLKNIDCSNTNISSLKGLENLHNLRKLWCHNTEIPSYEEELLDNLPELRKLLLKKYYFEGDDSFDMIY